MSRPQRSRYAIARRIAEMQPSTSSALTWMIGTLNPFAMSEAYGVERASSGSVVKPTWLSVMMWTVPPVE